MSDLRVVIEMGADPASTDRVRRLVVRDVSGRVIPCSGVIWTRHDSEVAAGTVDGEVARATSTVSIKSPERGSAVLLRGGLDFGGADLEIATQLLSVLASIHRRFVAAHGAVAPQTGVQAGASPPQISLTPREHMLLGMLSQGLTADAIGRRLSVTVKTVRKHLEHIYRKLGVHDRLLAVERARAEGLLGPWLPGGRPADARPERGIAVTAQATVRPASRDAAVV